MVRTSDEWHARFLRQARWTQPARRYLVKTAHLGPQSRVLEVGCGTGAITSWLVETAGSSVVGLDLNFQHLSLARRRDRQTVFCCGNALWLPFSGSVFDAVVCHFFLLWIHEPEKALSEMVRAAAPGGCVIAFAEPDYGGRIDTPRELVELGRLQAAGLRKQGAAPERGRELAGLFTQAGLSRVETGVMGGTWVERPSQQEIDSEWAVLESDLHGILPDQELAHYRQVNQAAWQAGNRVLFVPTFYAIGTKPHGT
jgi:SAM-dependent methyltransferase